MKTIQLILISLSVWTLATSTTFGSSVSSTNTVSVLQSQIAYSTSDSLQHILGTTGAGPCMIFAGWSPKYKVGFLAHIDSIYEIHPDYESGQQHLATFIDLIQHEMSLQPHIKKQTESNSQEPETVKMHYWVSGGLKYMFKKYRQNIIGSWIELASAYGLQPEFVKTLDSMRLTLDVKNGRTLTTVKLLPGTYFSGQQIITSFKKILPAGYQSLRVIYHPLKESKKYFLDRVSATTTLAVITSVTTVTLMVALPVTLNVLETNFEDLSDYYEDWLDFFSEKLCQ